MAVNNIKAKNIRANLTRFPIQGKSLFDISRSANKFRIMMGRNFQVQSGINIFTDPCSLEEEILEEMANGQINVLDSYNINL